MTEINPSAICPCGIAITVEEPQHGQTLYGTLADEMRQHEATCRHINANKQWNFDHTAQVIEGRVSR